MGDDYGGYFESIIKELKEILKELQQIRKAINQLPGEIASRE
jgi:hypothetical protein